jgi:hypothetical protein
MTSNAPNRCWSALPSHRERACLRPDTPLEAGMWRTLAGGGDHENVEVSRAAVAASVRLVR